MYKKIEIEKCCNTAIRNVMKEGTTDVELFERPFELNLLKSSEIRNEIVQDVIGQIQTGKFETLKVKKIGHVLVPKKNIADYRNCAIIDIIDEIKYLTIVLLMANDIEKIRINKSKKRIFSYRIKLTKNSDNLFDLKYNYTAFKNRISEKSKMKTVKVVVECDIANYYDKLNLHRLESTLMSMKNTDKSIVKILNELLLFWSNRDSYGLPVGSNASRILAELALVEVDNYLIANGIDFCRFVDDYRIFAKDASTAHNHLAILVQRLNKEGLFINTLKTSMRGVEYKNGMEANSDEESSIEQKNAKKVDMLEINKIIRGYSGLIPLKFRELSESEKAKLVKENEKTKLQKLNNELLIDPKDFTNTVKTIIAKEQYDNLLGISNILKKFPQFVPYFVNVLEKCQEKISKSTIQKIKVGMKEWLEQDNLPEYIIINIIRLFNIDKFKDTQIIMDYFRSLKRNSGDYIGRAILECLDGSLNRGEVIEIEQYYRKADIWEKRQILKLVQKVIHLGEKRPFLKDININSNDILEKYLSYTEKDKSNVLKYI